MTFGRVPFRRDQRFQYKLIAGFAFILALNGAYGAFCIRSLGTLSDLVDDTYDKALMSGTYAQSAKYNFARFDREVEAALQAADPAAASARLRAAARFADETKGDVAVVDERALSDGTRELSRQVAQKVDAATREARELGAAVADGESAKRSSGVAAWRSNGAPERIYDLLTRVSDSAAETGYAFRVRSESETKLTLRLSRYLIALNIAATVFIAGLLLMAALPPLRRLTETCEEIARGLSFQRVQIDTRDEFGLLGRSFNQMLDRIEDKDRNLESLLHALPDAVFFFDESGAISRERSARTQDWFPGLDRVRTIGEFFERYFGEDGAAIRARAAMVWAPGLVAETSTLLELLPARGTTGRGETTRHFELRYHPQFSAEGRPERIIVVAHDATAEVRAERDRVAQQNQIARILSVASMGYHRFRGEFYAGIERIAARLRMTAEPGSAEALERDRELHSLKGGLGVMGFIECAEIVHEVEDHVKGAAPAARAAALEAWTRFRRLFDEQTLALADLLRAEREVDVIRLPAEKRQRLVDLARRLGNPDLGALVESLSMVGFQDAFGKYRLYVQGLDREFPGKRCALRIDAPGIELTGDRAQEIDQFLVHLIRNSIDHGMEESWEREAAGKPATGTITLKARRLEGEGLLLDFYDDGRGIALDRLRALAVERGLWTTEQAAAAGPDEVLELIFRPHLSTKAEASQISGRGIGMGAVRDQIARLGGTLTVTSEPGAGTRFRIHLPAARKLEAQYGT